MDLDGLGRPSIEPGSGPFSFTRDAHRVLQFESEAELRALVSDAVRELEKRKGEVPRDSIKEYARSRLTEG